MVMRRHRVSIVLTRLVCGVVLSLTLVAPWHAAAEPSDVRVITFRVAVDEPYRAASDWEARLRSIVQAVSARWMATFNIRWEIATIVPWQSPSDLRLGPGGATTDDLATSVSRGSEHVLVFVSGHAARGLWCGEATPFGDVAAVQFPCRRGTDTIPDDRLLSHELAHLFGAFHVRTKSVMNTASNSDDFDSQTTRIVTLMRGLTLSSGIEAVDPSMRQTWTAIFAEGHAADETNLVAKALRNRGATLGREKKLYEAKALLEEAVRIDPQLADAYVDLGKIASEQTRPDDAVISLKRAIAIDPKHASAYEALGTELIRQQRFADGASALRTAVALEPSKAMMRARLGYALLYDGKLDDALRELDTAVRLDEANAYARRQFGDALTRKGQ